MKTVLATLFSAAVLAVTGGAAYVYLGGFNVAATDPHWSATYWVLDQARIRSIKVHAAGISPPTNYDEETMVAGAAGHFSEHCATCHGGPGIKPSVWAEGMYPVPPSLKEAALRYTPGELFWILKNGIKMSAMPSMASDGDEMLWSTVAFLRKLPTLSEEDFNELWLAAQASGGMNMDHGAMMDGGGMAMDHGAMMNGATNHGTMPVQGDTAAPAPAAASPQLSPNLPPAKPEGN